MPVPCVQKLWARRHQTGRDAQEQPQTASDAATEAAADVEDGRRTPDQEQQAPSATTPGGWTAWCQRQPQWLQKLLLSCALGSLTAGMALANIAATRLTLAYVVSGSALLAVQALGHTW
jgi:hypothetical protein